MLEFLPLPKTDPYIFFPDPTYFLKNLANDYWSSTFFMKLKEEAQMKRVDHELEQGGWNFAHRLSSVHCADDPFHQEHSPRKLKPDSLDIELQ